MPRPETAALRADLAATRDELAAELDRLDRTARDTLDPRAIVRRNAGKLAAGAGAAGFVALGGPSRVLRGVGRLLRGRPPAVEALLPEEIERTIEGLGDDAPTVRASLDRAFADYVQRRKAAEPSAPRSLFRFLDAVAAPLGLAVGRQLAARLFKPPRDEGKG